MPGALEHHLNRMNLTGPNVCTTPALVFVRFGDAGGPMALNPEVDGQERRRDEEVRADGYANDRAPDRR
jgi:hypothetical protein